MAGGVDDVEIERHECRPDVRRSAQHVQHHVDALRAADRLVELRPVARPRAAGDGVGPAGRLRPAPGHVGARPEHGRGAHARLLRGHPDGFGLVPPIGVVARHGELVVRAAGVLHAVGDDAIAVGPVARDDRPVIGEGLGGEGGAHRRFDPVGAQRCELRRHATLEIIGAKAVDRDEDGDGRALLRLGDRRGRLDGHGGAGAQAQESGKEEGEAKHGDSVLCL